MKRVGNVQGRGVWVRDQAGAFEVIFECEPFFSGLGEKLARLLAGDTVRFEPTNGSLLAVVVYDDVVDRRLVELIDLLVALRCAHPRMVQLELELGEVEAGRLVQQLQSVLPGVG